MDMTGLDNCLAGENHDFARRLINSGERLELSFFKKLKPELAAYIAYSVHIQTRGFIYTLKEKLVEKTQEANILREAIETACDEDIPDYYRSVLERGFHRASPTDDLEEAFEEKPIPKPDPPGWIEIDENGDFPDVDYFNMDEED